MWRVLQTEFIKLKNAPMLWISVLGIAVAPALNGAVYSTSAQRASAYFSWSSFMNQNLVFATLLLGASLFGLVATYLTAREYAENTLKNLLTLPIQRWWVVAAKLVVLLVWSLSLAVVGWAISLPIGLLVGLKGLPWTLLTVYLKYYLIAAGLIYLTLPITAWVAALGRGYIPALAFAGAMVPVGLVVGQSDKYGPYFPWAIPTHYALSLDQRAASLGIMSWAALAATFVVGTALMVLYLRYADVDR